MKRRRPVLPRPKPGTIQLPRLDGRPGFEAVPVAGGEAAARLAALQHLLPDAEPTPDSAGRDDG
jgi:hypothetical protein